ncbi:MAG TPA: hypothetical protein VGJ55_02735 [Pyrinomonadaceae bacterium]
MARKVRFAVHTMALALAIASLTTCCAGSGLGQARRRSNRAAICGNPMVACRTSVTFPANDLPFRVPKSGVIVDTESFYAIILQSMKVEYDNCDVFIPERERLAAQALFPDHKVFTSRCVDPENLFYTDETAPHKITNISETHRIMAVYAGPTLAEAKRFLESVKATGKFPGANIRRMRTGFNGT